MTYKDDLEKLRKEAGFDVNDPTSFARGKPDKPLSEDTSAKALSEGTSGSSSGADKRSPTGAFTSEEKKLTLWQKIFRTPESARTSTVFRRTSVFPW